MKDLQKIFAIEWERPLRWYDYLLLSWLNISTLIIAVDMDRTPFYLVVIGLLNFLLALWTCKQILPGIKDEEDEENETNE